MVCRVDSPRVFICAPGSVFVEFELLGWPDSGPTIHLDFRVFSYAGKFEMSNTGKAIFRDAEREQLDDSGPASKQHRDVDPELSSRIDFDRFEDDVVAAISFNADRTDESCLWLRYITVHRQFRGLGLGPRLAAMVVERARKRDYDLFRIAVNNPFAYQALYRAGFEYTGRQTGLAELLLERNGDKENARSTHEDGGNETEQDERDISRYQSGFDVFRDRDHSDAERRFLERKRDTVPPDPVEPCPPTL